MPDPTGTTRTAWAAGFGEYPLQTGDTREAAINAALTFVIDELDSGDLDPSDVEATGLTVYRDVLWCVGAPESDPYALCYCGSGHEDDEPWLAIAWSERERVELIAADFLYSGFEVFTTDKKD